MFFMYIFLPPVLKQIVRDANGNEVRGRFDNVKLFEVNYDGWEGMGVAMEYNHKEDRMRYYRFGEGQRWQDNENAFCAQFAHDNS